MNGKENQRVALTRRLLKEALTELLQKKSIRRITVVELCERAGINRSTFYTHYGCAQDVLREMEDDLIGELEAIWQRERGKQAKSHAWRSEQLCIYLKEHAETARIILGVNGVDSEFAGKLIHSCFVREVFQEFTSTRFDVREADMLFCFLTRGQYSMIRHWLLEDDSLTPQEMSRLVNDVGLHGWMKAEESEG
ncbi:MAG: TetR/AcrR family transcriptional regulator [Candidatus Faecivicinus sp.]